MIKRFYILPESEITRPLMRAIKMVKLECKVIHIESYTSPDTPIILDICSLRNSLLLSSTEDVVYKLRLKNWPNHMIILNPRLEPPVDLLGTTVVYSLTDILKLPFTNCHPLNVFELWDAKRPAILNKLERWLHDLKWKDNNILEEVFLEINESIDTISNISPHEAMKLKATKNMNEIEKILLSVRDSAQGRDYDKEEVNV